MRRLFKSVAVWQYKYYIFVLCESAVFFKVN